METTNLLPIILIIVTIILLAYLIAEMILNKFLLSVFLEELKFNSRYHVQRYEANKEGYYITTLKLDHHFIKVGAKSKQSLNDKADTILLDYLLLKSTYDHFYIALRKRFRISLFR